jgi:RND family efflux transporter MFP subunit
MKRNYLLPLALMAIIAACGDSQPETQLPDAGAPIPVKLIEPGHGASTRIITASGVFTTDDETFLSFKTGGVISRILVREGEVVSKGQLLAILDITEIGAGVQQARLAYEKAERDLARVENLFRDSVATLEQLQNARTGKEVAGQQLKAAEFNLAYSEIRARTPGVVLRKMANPGQVVGPGTPVLQTSSKGYADWLLRAGVSDKEWAAIRTGDSVEVRSDVTPDVPMPGIVSSKSEAADPATGSFTIEVRIVNGRKSNLASGMFGKAYIRAAGAPSVWKIPYEALLDGHGNRGYVFASNDGKTVKKVEVITGGMEKDVVRVAEGLEGFRYVVTAGSAYLTDGSAITTEIK